MEELVKEEMSVRCKANINGSQNTKHQWISKY